jgi:uncharacterized protein
MREPPSIDAYGDGGFRVSGVWRPGSLLILDDVPADWAVGSLAALTVADFKAVIEAGSAVSEFVLLGTGAVQALPPREIREALRAVGLGLEFMSTEAAARIHNVLASDGRRFASALIAI